MMEPEAIEAKWTAQPSMLSFLVQHESFERLPEGSNAWKYLAETAIHVEVVQ